MHNEENLVPIKELSKEKAMELGRKGGLKKTLNKKLGQRKICNNKCPIFHTCWAKYMDNKDDKGRQKCNLKEMPSRVVARTVRLIQEGEQGFNQELIETLLRLGSELETNPDREKSRERYLRQAIEVKKAVFGTKTQIEGELKTPDLSAKDFAEAWKKAKENDGK